jgi:hypothetical protein
MQSVNSTYISSNNYNLIEPSNSILGIRQLEKRTTENNLLRAQGRRRNPTNNTNINGKLDKIIETHTLLIDKDQSTKAELAKIIEKTESTKSELAEIKKLLQDVLKQPGYLNSISRYVQSPYNAVFGLKTKNNFKGGRKTRRKRK